MSLKQAIAARKDASSTQSTAASRINPEIDAQLDKYI
jgi:hypothetical protein